MTSQIKRCVTSIPSIITKGYVKESDNDLTRYLQISLNSCFELESHLMLCSDLKIIDETRSGESLESIQRLQKKIIHL